MGTDGDQSEGPRSDRSKDSSGSMRISVNVLCICAFIISVTAIFCSWIVVSESGTGEVVLSLGVDPAPESYIFERYDLYSIVFIVGTVLVFFSPLGSLLQIVAIADFYDRLAGFRSAEDSHFAYGSVDPGIGFYLGILSVSLAILSAVVPFGPGYGFGKLSLRQRFLVFSRKLLGEADEMPRPRGGLPKPSRASHMNWSWVGTLGIVLLLSGSLAYVDDSYTDEPPLLTMVGSSLVHDFHSLRAIEYPEYTHGWNGEVFSLGDGTSGVYWNLSNDGLDDGVYSTVEFGPRTLGPLTVNLTIIDALGDSSISYGDKFILTALNGTSFVEGLEYNVTLGYESGIHFPPVGMISEAHIHFYIQGEEVHAWTPGIKIWL